MTLDPHRKLNLTPLSLADRPGVSQRVRDAVLAAASSDLAPVSVWDALHRFRWEAMAVAAAATLASLLIRAPGPSSAVDPLPQRPSIEAAMGVSAEWQGLLGAARDRSRRASPDVIGAPNERS